MNIHFSRTIARLRKDKKISQREASRHLSISQALLSHYENGLREPGFDFLCRAADYYGCSTDYLLGRTLDKQGISLILDIDEGAEADTADERGLRILASANAMLLELMRLSGDGGLRGAAEDYLGISYSRLFRLLCKNSNMRIDEATAFTGEAIALLCDTYQKKAEHRILTGIEAAEKTLAFNCDEMSRKYPVRWSAILTVLKEIHIELEKLSSSAKKGGSGI